MLAEIGLFILAFIAAIGIIYIAACGAVVCVDFLDDILERFF